VTEWLLWFLQMLDEAVELAHYALDNVLEKAHFWQRVSGLALNEQQVKLIKRLLDGFEGKLTSSTWAAIAKF
jgi:Fic family protein